MKTKKESIENNYHSSKHYQTVFIAKGIGIILVVLGHYYPSNSPHYWGILNNVIYKFHMPLFFILSGYLFKGIKFENYFSHLRNKFKRLIYPFVTISILFFPIKFFAGKAFSLSDPLNYDSVIQLLICPIGSYMPLLWFVYSLFIMFVIYPLLEIVVRNRLVLFLLSIALIPVTFSDYLCLNLVMHNLPYFVTGVILANTLNLDRELHILWGLCGIVVSIAFFAIIYIININFVDKQIFIRFSGVFMGLSGAAACILTSMMLNNQKMNIINSVLGLIGFYSMSIYLLHTLFESPIRLLLNEFFNSVSFIFEIKAAIAILTGILMPLLIEKFFLRRNKVTKKFILGLNV